MTDRIQCPKCKASILADLQFCPRCGERIHTQNFKDESLGDLYKILQVDPSAEPEVIDAAYKRLAVKYHPDINKSSDAQSRMQEINAAYQVLSNAERRSHYDHFRHSGAYSDGVKQESETAEEEAWRKAKEEQRSEDSELDNNGETTSQEATAPVKAAPAQVSVWRQGAKASAVITGLYVIGQLFTPQNVPSFVGNLTFGLIATFFGWWLIFAGIIWLWRKVGAFSTIALFAVGGGLIFAVIYASNQAAPITNRSTTNPAIVPSRTPIPTRTATRTPRPTRTPGVANCTWWYEIPDSSFGKEICVQGVVEEITGNTEFSGKLRIYFRNLPRGYVWTDGSPASFYFTDDAYYYPDLNVGDCVYAAGFLRINQQGEYFIGIKGNLQSCG